MPAFYGQNHTTIGFTVAALLLDVDFARWNTCLAKMIWLRAIPVNCLGQIK